MNLFNIHINLSFWWSSWLIKRMQKNRGTYKCTSINQRKLLGHVQNEALVIVWGFNICQWTTKSVFWLQITVAFPSISKLWACLNFVQNSRNQSCWDYKQCIFLACTTHIVISAEMKTSASSSWWTPSFSTPPVIYS